MVRTEPRYWPSSSNVAWTAAGAVSTKRSLLSMPSSACCSQGDRARGGGGSAGRGAGGPSKAARLARARSRAAAPRHRPRAWQAAAFPTTGVSSCTPAITWSRRCRRSDGPARPRLFFGPR